MKIKVPTVRGYHERDLTPREVLKKDEKRPTK